MLRNVVAFLFAYHPSTLLHAAGLYSRLLSLSHILGLRLARLATSKSSLSIDTDLLTVGEMTVLVNWQHSLKCWANHQLQ